MEEIKVNRLPLLTYRYLHTNDTSLSFEEPKNQGEVTFSDDTYITEGGTLPASFDGASKETVAASSQGKSYTISVPDHKEVKLSITLTATPDFAGQFLVHVGKGSTLSLVWHIKGDTVEGTCVKAVYYELAENATLTVSTVENGHAKTMVYDQRHTLFADGAKAHFASAELSGEKIIVHSYGKLLGDKSEMTEKAVYAAREKQQLDLFYHIDHVGKKTKAEIDVKGALADESKKIFRGTLDFKRGCSGSVGDEGDYAIQLDPATKNISLPLLLCTEDNIQGNHASSAGQLDANTIYFLMSRGFSLEEARRIVVEALIRPIIDEMDESVRDEVLEAVRNKLDK